MSEGTATSEAICAEIPFKDVLCKNHWTPEINEDNINDLYRSQVKGKF
jgi:hypothetical protein